jgi:hypothetical protein
LIVAGKASPAQWIEARDCLTLWRDNDAKLQPMLAGSELTAELSGLSKSVSQVAGIGLEALDDLKNHRAMTADVRERNLQVLKAAGKPKAVLVDKLVAPVELLVNASAKRGWYAAVPGQGAALEDGRDCGPQDHGQPAGGGVCVFELGGLLDVAFWGLGT